MIGCLLLALWYTLGNLLTTLVAEMLLEMHESEEEQEKKKE